MPTLATLRVKRKLPRSLSDFGQALTFIVLVIVSQAAVYFGINALTSTAKHVSEGSLIGDIISATSAILSCVIYVAVIYIFERRATTELVLDRRAARFLAGGSFLGFALFSSVVLFMLLCGDGRILGAGDVSACGLALAGAITTSIFEEILFRGVVFRLLARHLGAVLGVSTSALLFGLMHLGGTGSDIRTAIAIALEAGVLLSLAFLVTGTLWFSIGIHIGWNFAESGVFGTEMSGFRSHGIARSAFAGPDWLTGGGFGLEAGVPAVFVCLVASIALCYFDRSSTWAWRLQQRRASR